jgi:BACON domain-containing protein
MSPGNQNFPAAGGTGSCSVNTSNNCQWSASSDADWIVLTSSSGTGGGSVSFVVAPALGDRSGEISLDQDHGASCGIRQSGPQAVTSPVALLTWESLLDLRGSGQVVLNGRTGLFQGRGRAEGRGESRRGENRIEAQLVAAGRGPGTWRFKLGGSFRPGTLRVVAGEALAVAADAIVFRLAGKPGERIAFAFEAEP